MGTDDERREAGLSVRREVLGTDYVERALAAASEWSADWQDQLNRNCWGEVWTRLGLDRRTRSLITLAMLAQRGASTELVSHTRGAFNNGCTAQEIKEVFLQVAVYAGVPAAVEAFRAAKSAVEEHEGAGGRG